MVRRPKSSQVFVLVRSWLPLVSVRGRSHQIAPSVALHIPWDRVDDYGAPSYPELVLCATRATIQENPTLARAVVRSLVRGYGVTLTDPQGSEADLAWLYPNESYQSAAEQLLHAGARLVVVTLGARGAFGAHRDLGINVDATPVELVDTIGAGDAFGAALLAWLNTHDALKADLHLEQADLESALDYACLAAAITCSRPGADPPWKGEIPTLRP